MTTLEPNENFEKLTRDLQDAVQQQDRGRLESLVGQHFRLITSRSGNPVSREEWISAATGPFRLESYELEDCYVIREGATAVVVHRLSQEARLGDREAARYWLTTDTWSRADGGWKVVARHAEALIEES